MQEGEKTVSEALRLEVLRGTSIPVYQQLVDGILRAIEEGRLRAGDALPSIRTVAAELAVNQMTVSKAYKSLSAQGVVRGQSGGGTRVLERTSTDQGMAQAWQPAEAFDRFPARMAELAAAPGVIAFTDAYPRFSPDDVDAFRECLDRTLTTYGASTFAYGPPAGKYELRELLAGIVGRGGVAVHADDLVLTSGAQQALDLSARLLLGPGDSVIVESPCYFGALDVFRSLGARIVELPISSEGISPVDFAEACAKFSPKAFYTIPTVHNPTGVTTSELCRRKLLAVARKFGCAVIEDDYCPEFSFSREHIPTYLSLAQGSIPVFYLRSLGKIYLPGIRLGFLIPPEPQLAQALQLKRSSDMHGPLLLQNAAELFLRDRVSKTRATHELESMQQRALLLHDELSRWLPTGCGTQMVSGGLSFWVSLPKSVKNEDLYFSAIRHSVAFSLGSAFVDASAGSSTGLRLSFGGLDTDQIEEGVQRIVSVLKAVFGATSGSANYIV